MSALSILTAFVALHGGFQQNKLSIDVYRVVGTGRTALSQNDSITGEVTFRVIAQTQEPIQAIEFYVGDDLRESDGSTPYEFKFDTLAEEDGPVKVRFKCFTAEGKNAEKEFKLNIDNGVSLGAAPHVEKGREYIAQRKFDDAINEGRIALKADKDNVPARILLAQANYGLGVYDKAQKFAEDALDLDKNNRLATDVLVSIRVQQAFTATSKSGSDRKDTIQQIKGFLVKAAQTRVKQLNADLEARTDDKFGKDYLDAVIRAKRYSLVTQLLETKLLSDVSNNEHNDRLLYAYLLTGRFSDANALIGRIKRSSKLSAYGLAIEAVLAAEASDDKRADKAIQDAFLDSPDSLGVKTAQAFIALKRNDPKVLADASNALLQDRENRSEAFYYVAALYNRLERINESRQFFERAIRFDPTDHDMYIEQGSQAISLTYRPSFDKKDRDYQLEYAKAMFEIALSIRENSASALTGIALVNQMMGRNDDALRYSSAASKVNPGYAAGWYFYSHTSNEKAFALGKQQAGIRTRMETEAKKPKADQNLQFMADSKKAIEELDKQILDLKRTTRTALDRASAADPRHLTGAPLPNVEEAFKYFNTLGRAPVLSIPAKG
jgi:tetratricopeptide (TPR) repeat protein